MSQSSFRNCASAQVPGLVEKSALALAALPWMALTLTFQVQAAVLNHSDVVFMYEADRKVYQEYGATMLAWGGKPTPKSLEQAQGMKFFGSVGMVTEFARYYERFPET